MIVPFRQIDTAEPSDEEEKKISVVNCELVMKKRVGMF